MYDYILIGQGICGSLLSWFLLQNGQKVLVIDKGNTDSATHVASGIINPITGKRFVKTWLADEIIPFAQNTYKSLETLFEKKFYQPCSIIKLFESIKEQNDWSIRASDENYYKYLMNQEVVFLEIEKVKNDFGGFEISGGGKLDTQHFLQCYRDFLKEKNCLLEKEYTMEEAINSKTKVIFCDGFQSSQQGIFKYLPWQIVKGEHLLVRIPEFYNGKIISGDTTISPTIEKDIYYVGGTYEWNVASQETTTERRKQLQNSLHKMLACDFEIIQHRAAIRPATKDRRAFVGFHQEHTHIGIFNGMGTKGISLAPYFAQHFAEHLVEAKPLNSEVDIQRFLA